MFAFAHLGQFLGGFLAVAWFRVDGGEVVGVGACASESDGLDVVDLVCTVVAAPVASSLMPGHGVGFEAFPGGVGDADAFAGFVGAVESAVFVPAGALVVVASVVVGGEASAAGFGAACGWFGRHGLVAVFEVFGLGVDVWGEVVGVGDEAVVFDLVAVFVVLDHGVGSWGGGGMGEPPGDVVRQGVL